LFLDFNALKSVVQAGKSGKWLLKPTIKVVETVTNNVSGKVIDEVESLALEGAMISAQENDEQPVIPDEADRVFVAAGTESDSEGDYFMYLPLLSPTDDPYNIVVTMPGYAAACQQLPSNETMAYTADFALTPLTEEETGTLSASVQGLADESASALFSIRQNLGDCGIIEVASFSVVNSTNPGIELIYSDPVTLLTGTYQVVVSAEGKETQVVDLDVGNLDYTLDIDFQ
jgi:hypothetical protein